MLTNSTISHLLINRNNLQYLDVAGLLAKYNLFIILLNIKLISIKNIIYLVIIIH